MKVDDMTCIVASAVGLPLKHLLCKISHHQGKGIAFETACIAGGVYYFLRLFKIFLLTLVIRRN